MIRKTLIRSTITAIMLNDKNEPVEVAKVITGKKISLATALKLMREDFGSNIILKDITEELITYECSIEMFINFATIKNEEIEKVED